MASELLHWFRRGDDTPVVLLHGFAGSAASWAAVVDGVSSKVTAVAALHLPGHHADAPVATTWDANIDWVIGALAENGIERCRLVGYSFGARTALGAAIRCPALIEDLVLIGVHPGLISKNERRQRRAADKRWSRLLESEGIAAFVDQWQVSPVFDGQSAAALKQQGPIRLGHDAHALAICLRHMGLAEMPDYRSPFRALDINARVVVGERDKKFYRLARGLIGQPIQLWGCGHNPLVDRPHGVSALI